MRLRIDRVRIRLSGLPPQIAQEALGGLREELGAGFRAGIGASAGGDRKIALSELRAAPISLARSPSAAELRREIAAGILGALRTALLESGEV